jgi:hypothetical protein
VSSATDVAFYGARLGLRTDTWCGKVLAATADVCPQQPFPNEDTMDSREEKRLESRARRVAKQAGLRVIKSRQRKGVPNLDNYGHFVLVDTRGGYVVDGRRFSMTASDVIDLCASQERS